jgi:hypothetical protein
VRVVGGWLVEESGGTAGGWGIGEQGVTGGWGSVEQETAVAPAVGWRKVAVDAETEEAYVALLTVFMPHLVVRLVFCSSIAARISVKLSMPYFPARIAHLRLHSHCVRALVRLYEALLRPY